jgi:NADPH:quinone reductase-like Zn-dependent oxidoreductase
VQELGPPDSLALEDVPDPRPGPEQAVVAVRAAGVNFPDVTSWRSAARTWRRGAWSGRW